MAKARSGRTATLLLDGRVLFTGGKCDGGCENSIEIHDPATGISSEVGTLLHGRSKHAAVLLGDGRVLISGGAEQAEIYDPGAGKSETFAALIQTGINASAFRLADGRVAIGCGGGPLKLVDVNRVSVELIPNRSFWCLGAALLPDGRILAVNQALNYALYDPAAKTFAFLPMGMRIDYDEFAAFTVSALPSGAVAVAGGVGSWYLFRDSLDLWEILTPPSQSSRTGALSRARYGHAACFSADGLILSGGMTGFTVVQPGSAVFRSMPLNSMEIREPENGRLAGVLEMNSARIGYTCTLLNDGSLLFAGGEGVSALERYIPSKGWPELTIAAAVPVRGEAIELYVSGLLESSPYPPQVTINGKPTEILYFAPGQINVRIPSAFPKHEAMAIQFTYLGRHSNAVTIPRPD